jgi:hypothetical protein
MLTDAFGVVVGRCSKCFVTTKDGGDCWYCGRYPSEYKKNSTFICNLPCCTGHAERYSTLTEIDNYHDTACRARRKALVSKIIGPCTCGEEWVHDKSCPHDIVFTESGTLPAKIKPRKGHGGIRQNVRCLIREQIDEWAEDVIDYKARVSKKGKERACRLVKVA